MAYQHTMSAELTLKRDITAEQVAAALHPLCLHWHWEISRMALTRYLEGDPIAIELVATIGTDHLLIEPVLEHGNLARVTVKTVGEVGYGYVPEIIRRLAGRLEGLVEPGCFRVSSKDFARDELVWFNASEEQVQAQLRKEALNQAVKTLSEAGINVQPDEILRLHDSGGSKLMDALIELDSYQFFDSADDPEEVEALKLHVRQTIASHAPDLGDIDYDDKPTVAAGLRPRN